MKGWLSAQANGYNFDESTVDGLLVGVEFRAWWESFSVKTKSDINEAVQARWCNTSAAGLTWILVAMKWWGEAAYAKRTVYEPEVEEWVSSLEEVKDLFDRISKADM